MLYDLIEMEGASKTREVTYRNDAAREDQGIYAHRIQKVVAVGIEDKCPEANKVVVEEHLALLPSFLHQNIFCRQRVDSKDL